MKDSNSEEVIHRSAWAVQHLGIFVTVLCLFPGV